MRERDNVCKYMDIALQHISDNVLSMDEKAFTKARDLYFKMEPIPQRACQEYHLRHNL